jgi:hypothetical protein
VGARQVLGGVIARDERRERPYRRMFEQVQHREASIEVPLQRRMHLDQQQRMASHIEKVFVESDGRHSECGTPRVGNRVFRL